MRVKNSGPLLHLDELSIFCTLTGDLLTPREHILAHVSHDQSFRLKLVQVSHQGLKIQMILDLLLEKVRFCNQEIGSSGGFQQGFCPFRVASIRDNLPLALHAQGQGRVSSGMLYAVRRDVHVAQALRTLERELSYVQCETLLDLGGARKEDFHCLPDSSLRAGWPRNDQWPASFADELSIQHKKGL